MIAGGILIGLGALAIALSLLEIVAAFIQSGHVVWKLLRRLTGRGDGPMSQMQAAMFWLQVIGLLLGGCVFVFTGLSVAVQ